MRRFPRFVFVVWVRLVFGLQARGFTAAASRIYALGPLRWRLGAREAFAYLGGVVRDSPGP